MSPMAQLRDSSSRTHISSASPSPGVGRVPAYPPAACHEYEDKDDVVYPGTISRAKMLPLKIKVMGKDLHQ